MKKIATPSFNIGSPIQQAALLIAIGITLSTAFIYLLILPLKKSMAASINLTDDAIRSNERISSVIRTTDDQVKKVNALQKEYDELQLKGILTPLFNSYAMRAKTLITPYAILSGLTIENVKELPPIPLQQPFPLQKEAFCRQPIEFTASGSYTQLTAFVSYVEKELPMSILSSLEISSQPRLPEIHKIKVSFEWPTKTELTSKSK
ncbi:MAG: hypothetical protein PF904_02615 [Kiritimatiellae bacterium]|jgi:Tfp pilus assembly protein PilO|nr:hypothetical protein [Kiritimatiellia bacterium]